MSLTDDVKASAQRGGGTCTVQLILEKLPADEAAELRQLLAAGKDDFPGTAIARALVKRGHKIAGAQIQNCRGRGHAH